MVIIGMISFPTESSKEMGKRFMEIPPLPTYITRKGPYFSSELGVGIKAMSIFECDPSKMAEAIEYVGNYYAHFIGVPGFTYTIGTWFEVKEAFKMIGLA
jgi:hypothetical protein